MVRSLFFTAATPSDVVDRCGARMQDESYLAFIDLVLPSRRPRIAGVPVLVLGAERDGILTPGEIRGAARAHGTEAEMFPGIGHDMMLDVGWEQVADRVDGWVRDALT